MTFKQLEDKLIKNSMKVLFDVSSDFKADVSKAPVVSGDLKRDWRHTSIKGGYAVTNNMIYAPKIWVGAPHGVASNYQVPAGLHPIYSKYKLILINEMKKVDL